MKTRPASLPAFLLCFAGCRGCSPGANRQKPASRADFRGWPSDRQSDALVKKTGKTRS